MLTEMNKLKNKLDSRRKLLVIMKLDQIIRKSYADFLVMKEKKAKLEK